jgi:hypothetical protein
MQTVIPDFTWQPSTRERYNDQLNVLFPAEWIGQAFLVGEPYDHDHAGRPRYRPHRCHGGEYQVGSRPVTVDEFNLVRV